MVIRVTDKAQRKELGFWELWSVVQRLGPAEQEEVIAYALFREGRQG
jgi:hypothetical protein